MATGYPPPPPLSSRPSGRHPLLEKGPYEQLHRNEVVETRPHTLHFGGFQIHKEHSQKLRVVNISPSSLRVSIIGPSTHHFEVRYDSKGLLAPGMSEDITVLFTPHEWRYHYDTVKIFCGSAGENLVVPIHAYPAANDITLPRLVDFGRVAIGTSRSKVIPLACKVPLQFEYEVTVLQAHPDFTISPLSGVIPPDSAAEVTVTFLPTRHTTAHAELEFNIAQFNFEPVVVSIFGSSAPDIAKKELLQNAHSEFLAADAQMEQEEKAERIRALQAKKNRAPIEAKPPVVPKEEKERTIDGVKVPLRVDKHATNLVLNQTAGRVPLKDLSAFIKDQRHALNEKTRRASQLDMQNERGDEDQAARELRFEMMFREIERMDREKELKSETARGEDPMTPAEIEAAKRRRQLRQLRAKEAMLEADISRVEPVLSQGRAAVPNGFRPAAVPTWDEDNNDTFSVRLQVIERFVRAGAKCLMRIRARDRAQRLRKAILAAGVIDRKSCAAWVEAENRAVASGGSTATAAGKLEVIHFPVKTILPIELPTRASENLKEAPKERPVPELGDFKEYLPAHLTEREDWKVLGYERFSAAIPPAAAHMRVQTDRKRLEAALDEHTVTRGPRGEVDAVETPLEMPDSCLLPPAHDALSLLVPSTECRTYVALPPMTECEPGYALSQPPPLIEPLQAEPLLPPDIMCLDQPWLDVWRERRQIADPFQYSDPYSCSFAEAGGSLGPRLGCDAGGELLSFLPVGGFSRDIPSDTDDDDCGEFELPAPVGEEYDKALQGMEGPLECELWRKEEAAEERLRRLCDANNRAVRERLVDLNQHVDYSNKLFLG